MNRYLTIRDHLDRPIPRVMAASPSGGYEGASTGRRFGTWGLSSSGANAALFGSMRTLRNRSHEMIRNDPLTDGGMDTLVAHLVGTGITPRWQFPDEGLNEIVREKFDDWVKECDHYELLSFYGLQFQVAQCLAASGETLTRFLYPRDKDLIVPLQLQTLEPDHLDETFNTLAPNGNKVRMGIEWNGAGKRAAYWIWPEHPGEYESENWDRIRIPAVDMAHVFRPLRPGQQRGRPWLASVLAGLHGLDKYDNAEMIRKEMAALFGGFLIMPPDELGGGFKYDQAGLGDTPPDGQQATAQPIPQEIFMEPGKFAAMPQGYEVKFAQPADVGGNYEAFIKRNERKSARGIGLPYEKFTGDLTDVNFSSIRSGNLDFHRLCRTLIQHILVFQYCRKVVTVWLDRAVLAGVVPINPLDYLQNRRSHLRHLWDHEGWEWVDPEKDLNAAVKGVRSGLSTLAIENGLRGRDAALIDAENARGQKRAEHHELVYDSYPAHTDRSGKIQGSPGQKQTEDTT